MGRRAREGGTSPSRPVTRNLRFHPLATAEVVEAQLWYEGRINGLGTRFLGAVRATAERASRWPNAGTPTRHDHSGHPIERKVAVAGFPYVAVYRLIDDDLEILAVHHEHRRPFYWTDRATE